MIPPDYSVDAQPAIEDIANALQMMSDGAPILTRTTFLEIRRLLENALQKLRAVPPAEQDTPQ